MDKLAGGLVLLALSPLASLTACADQTPTAAAFRFEPAPAQTVPTCLDETDSGGEKGSQLVVPALADAIEAYVGGKPANVTSGVPAIAGMTLVVHFVDLEVGTETEPITVKVPAVPGLAAAPTDPEDKAGNLAWSEARTAWSAEHNTAAAETKAKAEELRARKIKPTASGVYRCLASFGDVKATQTILVSDGADNVGDPGGHVAGPLSWLQLCPSGGSACDNHADSVTRWWTEHGGTQPNVTRVDPSGIAGQIGDLL
jgi:hypothetical protein